MNEVQRFSDGRPVPENDGTDTQVHFANDQRTGGIELPDDLLSFFETPKGKKAD